MTAAGGFVTKWQKYYRRVKSNNMMKIVIMSSCVPVTCAFTCYMLSTDVKPSWIRAENLEGPSTSSSIISLAFKSVYLCYFMQVLKGTWGLKNVQKWQCCAPVKKIPLLLKI